MPEKPLSNVHSKLPKLITELKNNLSCRPRPMTVNINQSLKAINLSATNSQSKLPTIKPKQPPVKIIPPVAKDETPDSTLMSETKNDSLDINMHDDVDFTKLSVKFIRLTTPELRDTVYALNVNIVKDISQGDVIWYDGQYKSKNYANIHPSKYVNKIPDLCYLCKNIHFFGCHKQMKEKYPDFCKDYIPMTFLLPDEIDEFKEANSTNSQWILRQSINGTNTCALIDDPLNFTIPKKGGIGQPLIPPFLIDSHKFALRMYAVISNLNPLTIHFYKEGIAYFCAEPYDAPKYDNKLSYIFDPKCTPKDDGFKYYRPASTVISTISETNPNLLKQIKDIIILSIFSICPDMKKRVELACENNDKSFDIGDDSIIPPFERFIHLVGVDIQIDENGNPFVVRLKDNPGLKSTDEDEKKIKCELIKSQLALMISLIEKSKKEVENWEQIFSSNTLQFKPKTPDHPKRNYYSPRRIRNILNQNKKELNDI